TKYDVAHARAITAETDVEKLKLKLFRAEDHIGQLITQIAKLEIDLRDSIARNQGADKASERLEIIEELRATVAKFNSLKDALFGAEDDVWTLREARPPDNFEQRMRDSVPKIITVVNLKGGVGKTTLVSGLAGYFATHGKRVLLVDFDYQGSLTRMMMLG